MNQTENQGRGSLGGKTYRVQVEDDFARRCVHSSDDLVDLHPLLGETEATEQAHLQESHARLVNTLTLLQTAGDNPTWKRLYQTVVLRTSHATQVNNSTWPDGRKPSPGADVEVGVVHVDVEHVDAQLEGFVLGVTLPPRQPLTR